MGIDDAVVIEGGKALGEIRINVPPGRELASDPPRCASMDRVDDCRIDDGSRKRRPVLLLARMYEKR